MHPDKFQAKEFLVLISEWNYEWHEGYNYRMKFRKYRRFLALIILLLSISILLWSLWPLDDAVQSIIISPEDMQMPTPEGFFPGIIYII
jgi:hypothetical protein